MKEGETLVEFLKTVGCMNFTFEEGKRYVSCENLEDESLKKFILVRQPDSPKDKNIWREFPKACIGDILKVLDDDELDFLEKREENRLLQL